MEARVVNNLPPDAGPGASRTISMGRHPKPWTQAVFAKRSAFGAKETLRETLSAELILGAKSNSGAAVWVSVSMPALVDFWLRFRTLFWARGTPTLASAARLLDVASPWQQGLRPMK
jgi:hypothetical protein